MKKIFIERKQTSSFMWGFVVAILGAFVSFCTYGADLEPEYSWKTFRTNFLYARYFRGNVFTGTVAWTPGVQFNPFWGTRILAGVSVLKDANPNGTTYFVAPEVQILNQYFLFPKLCIEVGAGMQAWTIGNFLINPMLTANVHYKIENFFLPIDTVFAGYSAVWETLPGDQVRVGVQFNL